jgi:hypothetical protein
MHKKQKAQIVVMSFLQCIKAMHSNMRHSIKFGAFQQKFMQSKHSDVLVNYTMAEFANYLVKNTSYTADQLIHATEETRTLGMRFILPMLFAIPHIDEQLAHAADAV